MYILYHGRQFVLEDSEREFRLIIWENTLLFYAIAFIEKFLNSGARFLTTLIYLRSSLGSNNQNKSNKTIVDFIEIFEMHENIYQKYLSRFSGILHTNKSQVLSTHFQFGYSLRRHLNSTHFLITICIILDYKKMKLESINI